MAITNNNFIILEKDGVKVQMRKDKLSARGKSLELFELVDNQSGVSYECALPFVINEAIAYTIEDAITWIDEGAIAAYIPLEVTAGLFDFSYNYVEKWVFADGSESTDSRPTRNLTQDQTVKLYVTSFNGELNDNSTDLNYVGNVNAMTGLRNSVTMINTRAHGNVLCLSNLTKTANFFGSSDIFGDIVHLRNLTNTANFSNTKVTGDIVSLSNVTNYANFSNTKVFGDIVSLSKVTNYVNFGSTEVTGDIVSLSNVTNYVNFSNTKVFGDIVSLSKVTNFVNFDGTEVAGDIIALSKVTHTARFYYTNVTGDVASLSNITDTVNLTGTKVNGDIVAFKNIAQTVSLGNTDVYGDISNLQKSNDFISLQNCSVSGVLNPKNNVRIIYLDGTDMTEEDTLQSLRNMDTNFTTTKTRSIQLVNNIDQSSSEVVTLLNSLVSKGCTIIFV